MINQKEKTMEKKILKKIDNIRNNLLHSIDELKDKENYQDLNVEKLDILENISSFRAHLVKIFNKTEKKD